MQHWLKIINYAIIIAFLAFLIVYGVELSYDTRLRTFQGIPGFKLHLGHRQRTDRRAAHADNGHSQDQALDRRRLRKYPEQRRRQGASLRLWNIAVTDRRIDI